MDSLPAKPPQDAATILLLRRGIGIVGMALPFVLTIGNALFVHRFTLLGSISGSYYTHMRDVFVGSLCAIGVFLICYRYERLDDLLSTLAGVLAITVAVFPTTPDRRIVAITSTDTAIGRVHMISAAALFLLLAFFCLFLFTRTDRPPAQVTAKKRTRNRIYYACGGIILACVVLALASNLLSAPAQDTVKPLFWCETIAVLAFGAAWLVKGETIFKDSQPPATEMPGGGPIPAPSPPADVTM
jgi:hypothetical protein